MFILVTLCNIIVIDFNKNGGTIFVGREDCLTIYNTKYCTSLNTIFCVLSWIYRLKTQLNGNMK